jgi:membrane protein implicated in regulation of membrane protease activity
MLKTMMIVNLGDILALVILTAIVTVVLTSVVWKWYAKKQPPQPNYSDPIIEKAVSLGESLANHKSKEKK